jgi:uncharacterized protein YaaR (DUF327 family)
MPDRVDNLRRPGRTKVSSTRVKKQPPTVQEPAQEPSTAQASFDQVLAGVSGSAAEKKLSAILTEIGELAGILSHRRLLEDLERYRKKVGEFLKVFLDEVLDLREAAGRRGTSRRKQMLVVKRVDVELEELSRMVLGGDPDFRILKELETIEGLLLDLYH